MIVHVFSISMGPWGKSKPIACSTAPSVSLLRCCPVKRKNGFWPPSLGHDLPSCPVSCWLQHDRFHTFQHASMLRHSLSYLCLSSASPFKIHSRRDLLRDPNPNSPLWGRPSPSWWTQVSEASRWPLPPCILSRYDNVAQAVCWSMLKIVVVQKHWWFELGPLFPLCHAITLVITWTSHTAPSIRAEAALQGDIGQAMGANLLENPFWPS